MAADRSSRKLVLIVLLTIAAVGLTSLVACSGDGDSTPKSPRLEDSATSANQRRSWAGSEPAPEFPPDAEWLNTPGPVQLADFLGRAIILDFWTLGCINCQHIVPDLKRLEEEFGDQLVVIGVHSGKYDEERDPASIREAIRRLGLEHPVVNDPDFQIWQTYGVNAWPTLVLIDPTGNVVGSHAGEGAYDLFEPILTELLGEFAARGLVRPGTPPVGSARPGPATLLSYPAKAIGDTSGRLYVADSGHNRIMVVGPGGAVERVIGSGREGLTDGGANEAEFSQPQGLTLSKDELTLYVADTRNHAVRSIDLRSDRVSTIAGTGAQLKRLPGRGARAQETDLASPWDVLVRGSTLYVSMAGVHQLWSIDLSTLTLAVLAGTSREGINDGDPLRVATLAQPSGLAADDRYLYWVDPESSSVRRIPFDGDSGVETIVGTGLFDFGYRDGDRATARLQHAQGLAMAGGTLYVADTYNHRIRTVDPGTGEVGTLTGGSRGWADGPGEDARFAEPAGISTLPDGRLLVADQANHLLRVVDARTGDTSTLALANPAAAGPGRLLRIDLPGRTVAPGAGSLNVVLRSPADHHLNSLAPSVLELTTTNPAVVAPGEATLRWSSDEAMVSIPIPALYGEGVAEIVASGVLYYCRTGEEALCFIQRVELHLPVRVQAGAPAGDVTLEYELPPGPA